MMLTQDHNLQKLIDAVRADVAPLHGEVVRYGQVVWTAGKPLRPRAERRSVRHQAVRRVIGGPHAGRHDPL
jgi:hypothetical protein